MSDNHKRRRKGGGGEVKAAEAGPKSKNLQDCSLSVWKDLSGNGVHSQQNSETSKPEFDQTEIGIEFNRDQSDSIQANSSLLNITSDGLTQVIVFKPTEKK